MGEREILGYFVRGGGGDGILLIPESFLKPIDPFKQGFQKIGFGATFFGDRVCERESDDAIGR